MGAMISRVAFAVVLVLLTWNPSGVVVRRLGAARPLGVRRGEGLLRRAAARRLGVLRALGVGVAGRRSAWCWSALLLATIVWMLVQFGVVRADSSNTLAWIAIVAVGIALGVGVSWSKVRQSVSGQVEAD